MLRRVPVGHHRQCDGERRAGDAEQNPERQRLGKRVDAQHPGREQPEDDDELHGDRRAPRLPLADEHAVGDAQDRACKHRRCDHQSLLAGVEIEIAGDQDGERPEQHPRRKAHVEIEKAGDQGRQMARLEESAFHNAARKLSAETLPDPIRRRAAISSRDADLRRTPPALRPRSAGRARPPGAAVHASAVPARRVAAGVKTLDFLDLPGESRRSLA